MDSSDALSRSRYRERRLKKETLYSCPKLRQILFKRRSRVRLYTMMLFIYLWERWKRETGKRGTKTQVWKTQDCDTRDPFAGGGKRGNVKVWKANPNLESPPEKPT